MSNENSPRPATNARHETVKEALIHLDMYIVTSLNNCNLKDHCVLHVNYIYYYNDDML